MRKQKNTDSMIQCDERPISTKKHYMKNIILIIVFMDTQKTTCLTPIFKKII